MEAAHSIGRKQVFTFDEPIPTTFVKITAKTVWAKINNGYAEVEVWEGGGKISSLTSLFL